MLLRRGQNAHFDLVLAIQLVIVKRVFGDSGAGLVQILDEGNVLLRWDKTHFVQIWVSVKFVVE